MIRINLWTRRDQVKIAECHAGNRSFIAPRQHGAMPLARRTLLATVLGAAAPPRVLTLRPGAPSAVGFAALPQERLAFRAEGLTPPIIVPAARARLAAALPIAGRQVAVLAFAADPQDARGRLDLAALAGWDGAGLRVLALEVLSWQAPGGGWLGTRITAAGDGRRLLLTRDAAAPRGARPWRRESWTDLLAWQDGAALADAPARAPLPGTWQAQLAATRARVAARLGRVCSDVAEDVLALLRPDALPPG